MKSAANLISWVFMPLFMPIYALLLALFVPSNQDYVFNVDCLYILPTKNKLFILLTFFIFCVMAPGFSFLLLRGRNLISSIEMEDRKERTIPILIMFAYCFMLFLMLYWKTGNAMVSKYIYALPLSGAVVTAVYLLLNRWSKVSIHAGASGIMVGFTLAYILNHAEYQPWVFGLTIVLSGIVMSARLFLKKHTLSETIIGWFTGTLITFGICFFYH
ncbi:MAG: hypothetical protein QNK23_17050 [Crocinitomicaceae bacterium]|nr:hypothetical protein [Crocinitomicaceae bacterium]